MELNTWFECKVSRDQIGEDGCTKKVKEVYLVDAMSFAEAEARVIKELTPYTSGEFDTVTVKKCRFTEVVISHSDEDERFYKAKLIFMTIDENSGKEKDTPQNILVQAKDFHDSIKKVEYVMKGSLVDYQIASILETPIMDVFGN